MPNIQWLIDTKQRLQQYLEIAQLYALSLHVNIEIDVGLHRGGVQWAAQNGRNIKVDSTVSAVFKAFWFNGL